MIETIEVTIKGKKYELTKGITLEEVANVAKDGKYPILLARVNNRLKELTATLTEDAEVEFLDLTTREGNRCHISGLTYILLCAIKKLYGRKANMLVQHSLDKGIYIETNFKITKEKVATIKEAMQSIVDADMPITKVTIDRIEAMNYFENIGDHTKASILKYNTNTFVNLYRLGNYYNYFYNYMPISTERIKDFDLTYIRDNGFLLRFPTVYINDKIKDYEPHPNMFEVFEQYRDWAKIMKIENSAELNEVVSSGKINDLIKIDENLQSSRLLSIAKEINDKKNKVRIVLLAGPSSSGKTTTSKKLCMYLKSFGLNPKVLGMDDYFLERNQTPKDEDGNYDFECLEALDLDLFDKQIAKLLDGESVKTPTYNFYIGKKEYKQEMVLEKNDILVIEGIHALDNKVLTNIERNKKYKIYISALTEINMDDHNRISTTDNRLLRRIIRDNRTRGHPVEETLAMWKSVREGEEKYIFPYQDEADATFNSALIYELGVLKTYVEPLLYSVPADSEYYEESIRLLNFLRLFLPIPSDAIPEDSIIREFIGGSYFE